jgi:hypothetical protein
MVGQGATGLPISKIFDRLPCFGAYVAHFNMSKECVKKTALF